MTKPIDRTTPPATPPAAAPKAEGLSANSRRGLGIAIMLAKANCCTSCKALVLLRDELALQLEAEPETAPVPAPAAAPAKTRYTARTH